MGRFGCCRTPHFLEMWGLFVSGVVAVVATTCFARQDGTTRLVMRNSVTRIPQRLNRIGRLLRLLTVKLGPYWWAMPLSSGIGSPVNLTLCVGMSPPFGNSITDLKPTVQAFALRSCLSKKTSMGTKCHWAASGS